MSGLLNPLSDGIGADIIFLSELIRGDVILKYLSHDGLLLGLGHRMGTNHGSDMGQLDKARVTGGERLAIWLDRDIRKPSKSERRLTCKLLQR